MIPDVKCNFTTRRKPTFQLRVVRVLPQSTAVIREISSAMCIPCVRHEDILYPRKWKIKILNRPVTLSMVWLTIQLARWSLNLEQGILWSRKSWVFLEFSLWPIWGHSTAQTTTHQWSEQHVCFADERTNDDLYYHHDDDDDNATNGDRGVDFSIFACLLIGCWTLEEEPMNLTAIYYSTTMRYNRKRKQRIRRLSLYQSEHKHVGVSFLSICRSAGDGR